jgi:prepilin-type N-terminal cleavage/methylation domain-containing protein
MNSKHKTKPALSYRPQNELQGSNRPHTGFTLVELLVVIAMVALLASTIAPILARTKPNAQAFQCVNNLGQIMKAMTLYAYDYHDLLPPNPDDGNTTPGYTWCAGQAGVGGADQFNPDLLRDPRRTLVAPYLNSNVTVFRCTADSRAGLYDGAGLYPGSSLIHKVVPAARSISMNNAVGTVDPGFSNGSGHSGVPNLAVNGPWLTGTHGQNTALNGPWRTYGKLSQMVAPVPSKLWVMTEESPLSVNDGVMAMSVGRTLWVDYPSTLHSFGGVLAFADGHSELHQWMDPSTRLNGFPSGGVLSAETNDWSWLAVRTSARLH